MILAGHAGGTKTVLAVLDPAKGMSIVREVMLPGRDPVCAEALDLFVSIFGAQAGKLALETLALGGLVVGGDIAPKILARLADGRFMAAFRANGRLDSLLSTVQVRVALDPRAPQPQCARHEHPLTLPSPPSGGEGIETAPSPSERERVGVRVAHVFTHNPR